MVEKLYVMGHPVAHSKSPVMHNAAYHALGLRWEYGCVDCPTEIDARVFLNARNWRACNVTMPWKPLAYEAATTTTEAADLAQGANVLVNWAGRLHADNTDGKGCIAYLARCGVQFDSARVSICGTGPTSLAIAHACATAGASHVHLLGRDRGRAQQAVDEYLLRLGQLRERRNGDAWQRHAPQTGGKLCRPDDPNERAEFANPVGLTAPGSSGRRGAPGSVDAPDRQGAPGGVDAPGRRAAPSGVDVSGERIGSRGFECPVGQSNLDELRGESAQFSAHAYDSEGLAILAESSVIIDGTPLGMAPQDPAPFDTSILSPDQAVLDVVYGHGETALIAAARETGCAAYDGAGMLVAQAVETVYDIADVTGYFSIPSHMDLFSIMAEAAGFDL